MTGGRPAGPGCMGAGGVRGAAHRSLLSVDAVPVTAAPRALGSRDRGRLPGLGLLGGARQDPEQVGQAVQVGEEPAVGQPLVVVGKGNAHGARRAGGRSGPSRGRRTARVSPGTTNSCGSSIRASISRSIASMPSTMRGGHARDAVARPCRGPRGWWPAPRRPRTARAGSAARGRRGAARSGSRAPPALAAMRELRAGEAEGGDGLVDGAVGLGARGRPCRRARRRTAGAVVPSSPRPVATAES